MSAWIVGKAVVDCLVQQAVVERLVSMTDADEVGQTLWQECHNSVNYRYNESTECPSYVFEGIEAPLELGAVLKQVYCFDYQSCEHPEWESSDAYRLSQALADRLLEHLGLTKEQYYDGGAWDSAPWGIEDLSEVAQTMTSS